MIALLNIIECFLCAKYYFKQFTCTNTFNSFINPMRKVLFSPLNKWGNKGTEWLSNLPDTTQLMSCIAENQ